MRLWIDTDIGDNPDDAIALLCAVAHPRVELVGISTVDGDVVARAEAVRSLLARLGAPVPLLYAGPPDPRALATADAILAIGPLTNLGRLVRHGVTLPPLAVMGGVLNAPIRHRGALHDVDTNFARDAFAAAVVVHGADDLLLVPLDVTSRLTLDDAEMAALRAATPQLTTMIDTWRVDARAPICLHDPAALLALCGEHVTIARRNVAVDARGALIVDVEGARELDVVVDADRDGLVHRVLALVADATTASAEPTPSYEGD